MFIQENQLLEDMTSDVTQHPVLRVLRIHTNGVSVACINIWGSNADVEWYERDVLEQKVEDGDFIILKLDPYLRNVQRTDDDLTDSQLQGRDERYKLIEPIILDDNGMTIYFPQKRSRLIATIHRETGVARSTLYRLIRLWLQRGQIKNALIPDFHYIGNRGHEKRIGTDKRGRPRKLPITSTADPQSGVNITPLRKKLILKGMDEFYVKGGFSFKQAYEKTLEKYFRAGYDEHRGIQIAVPLPVDERPTYDQVYYWYNKERDPEYEKKNRKKRQYPLEDRPIDGDRFMMASSPGHWQIDAVDLPVYLVNPFNPSEIVGKAKAVVIVDTATNLIIGFVPTHGNESWLLYTLAIENGAADKVKFCAKYGIPIRQEEWPCNHTAYTILADRGPMQSYNATQLAEELAILVVNNPAYRPDLKGTIENQFLQFWREVVLALDLPGRVKPRERGDSDYIIEAALTLYELTQIFIYFVLWHNNSWRMTEYPLTREMTADGVQPYPIEVWNWYLENLSGPLRVVEGENQMRVTLALLPRDTASVDRKGIYFKGLHYRNEIVEKRLWSSFNRKKQPSGKVRSKNLRVRDVGRRKPTLKVSYDPRLVDEIYVRLDAGHEIQVCKLSARREDQRFKGCSWEEVAEYKRIEREFKREHSTQDLHEKFKRNGLIGDIVEHALQRRDESTSVLSKRERKANIGENRRRARREEDRRRLNNEAVPSPEELEDNVNEETTPPIPPVPKPSKPAYYIGDPKRKRKS